MEGTALNRFLCKTNSKIMRRFRTEFDKENRFSIKNASWYRSFPYLVPCEVLIKLFHGRRDSPSILTNVLFI